MNIIIIGIENEIGFVKSDLKVNAIIKEIVVNETDNDIYEKLENENLSETDFIVIASISYEIRNKIYDCILNYNSHLKEKIIDYYKVAFALMKPRVVDRVFNNPKYEVFDTLVLGISHAEMGILPDRMSFPTANISVSSQDIYYNYEALMQCIRNYPNKIVKLKHVIIDMFDYTYFNFDTSLTSQIALYISAFGGVPLPHNYERNRNNNIDFDTLVQYGDSSRLMNLQKEQIYRWDTLFGKRMGAPEYYLYCNRPFIETVLDIYEPDVCKYKQVINTSIVSKIFEETLLENNSLFTKLLDTIYAINPNMDVKLIILPNYNIRLEEDELMEKWKNYFYGRIEEYITKYPIEFYDFKYCEISENVELFYNIDHLNYNGACIFTDVLNDIIYG